MHPHLALLVFEQLQIERLKHDLRAWPVQRQALPTAEPDFVRVPAHRRSYARASRVAAHGTLSKYTHGQCRCLPCRVAHSAYQAQHRRRLLSHHLPAVSAR